MDSFQFSVFRDLRKRISLIASKKKKKIDSDFSLRRLSCLEILHAAMHVTKSICPRISPTIRYTPTLPCFPSISLYIHIIRVKTVGMGVCMCVCM